MTIGATRIRALADKFKKEPAQSAQEEIVSAPKEKQIQPAKVELQFVNIPLGEPVKEEEETCST